MNLTIELYVTQVSRRLKPHVPSERRRAIRRELREHLRGAAAEVGPEAAVRQAGPPDEVARDYVEAELGRPRLWRPWAGVVAAAVAYLLLAVLQQRELHLNRAPHWGRFDPWSADLWLLRLHGDLEQTLIVHVYVQRIAYLLIPLVAFLLWSRVWRRVRPAWRRRAPDRSLGLPD
jgi:hypothetical protein